MTRIVRNVSKKFLIAVNGIVIILFILACCTSFLNPTTHWFIGILGVGFPFIVLVLIFFIFLWWFFNSKLYFFSLAALILGWFQVSVLFAFNPFASFNEKKPANTIRIMQWNVARLGQMNKKKSAAYARTEIFKFIKKMNPDVLCMQEFLEWNKPKEMEENIPYITKQLNYPYYYFAIDHKRRDKSYEHGVIILSKYPIVDTSRIRYFNTNITRESESLIQTDINVNNQRIRIFSTHLQSLQFESDDYSVLEKIAKVEDSAVATSKGVLKKFRTAYAFRSQQADLIRKQLDNSPYPEIICGDFNDIPNSYTYFKIKGDRNDAFIKKGFGISRTFTALSPTLRIDYIFTNKKMEIVQFKNSKIFCSDHFPLIADVKLPEKD